MLDADPGGSWEWLRSEEYELDTDVISGRWHLTRPWDCPKAGSSMFSLSVCTAISPQLPVVHNSWFAYAFRIQRHTEIVVHAYGKILWQSRVG